MWRIWALGFLLTFAYTYFLLPRSRSARSSPDRYLSCEPVSPIASSLERHRWGPSSTICLDLPTTVCDRSWLKHSDVYRVAETSKWVVVVARPESRVRTLPQHTVKSFPAALRQVSTLHFITASIAARIYWGLLSPRACKPKFQADGNSPEADHNFSLCSRLATRKAQASISFLCSDRGLDYACKYIHESTFLRLPSVFAGGERAGCRVISHDS